MTSKPTCCQFTTTSGTKLHYNLSGTEEGSLIILLHGLGGSSETFTPLLPYLPLSTHTVVAVDFEGFGETPLEEPATPLSIQRYVADLDDLITSLQNTRRTKTTTSSSTKPVIIIGHSLGSIVALQYAAREPRNVVGLGLLGVGRSASHIPAVRDRMLALAKLVRTQGIEAAAELAMQTNFPPGKDTLAVEREEVRRAVAKSNPEAYAQVCEAMVDQKHQDPDYSAISCPVVFVSGRGDTISPPLRAKELAPLLRGDSDIFVVEGGHQPVLSDLEGTRRAIDGLFNRIGA
ncbi:hypothetical protein LTR62_008292 [Meristemomyces frigidus]|uniref:AB hydrolase-1 domain-containing protein n=1 Tax=Meristemomyces frigidus TaxID=1508187 RepID=A0AAN7TL11_9PEZI|nr:hypothetical protein LTR62_008292 [Meristemomyces frigidus]